jgi:hypothetical protein
LPTTPLLGRLATHAPATFAAFGESLRIHNARVVPRGGDAASAPWEAVVGEKLDRPERFVTALFDSDRGRLAYLYDVLAHLDAPQLAQALGASRAGQEPALKRLAALAHRAFPEWDVTTAPFVRPQTELSAFFARLQNASAADGEAHELGVAPSGSASSANPVRSTRRPQVRHRPRRTQTRSPWRK